MGKEGNGVLRDLLLLINEDIPLDLIGTWTEEQKRNVCMWAGRVFVKANDNSTIKVPSRPSFLPVKKEVANG